MNIDPINKFNLLSNVTEGERWALAIEGVISCRRNEVPTCSSARLCKGSNSLALVIQRMTREMQHHEAVLAKMQKEVDDKSSHHIVETLSVLQTRVSARIARYNSQHGIIYKFIMRLLGRDIDAAANQFQATCMTIKALFKKTIPIDRTADLSPLTNHHKFSTLDEAGRFVKFSIYIHLLPLARHLQATFDEVAELVMTNSIRRDDIPVMAVKLIKFKNPKDLLDVQKVLEILDEAGMSSFFYHGTNVCALEVMREHGLGTTQRDYDVDLLRRVGVVPQSSSGRNTDVFYVSGLPDYSYAYANRSPEWMYMSGRRPMDSNVSDADRKQFHALRERYEKTTEIALIQIQLSHTPDSNQRRVQIGEIRRHDIPESFLITQYACHQNVNKQISNADFNPVSVVFYRLPRLSIKS